MTPTPDMMDLVGRLKAADEAFAVATVVRTACVTAAKSGAKAIVRSDGTIAAGWIGDGGVRGAVLKAAREALADGQSRLVSVQPEDLPRKMGVQFADGRDGAKPARSLRAGHGTMDIFVEPVLPRPALIILGSSPVATELARQAPPLGYHVTIAAPAGDFSAPPEADRQIDGFQIRERGNGRRFVVVSTQGRGDEIALRVALSIEAEYHAFVASRRKMIAFRQKLISEGIEPSALDRVKAPAGLDLGSVTPEEIALSILAEMTIKRRLDSEKQPPATTGAEHTEASPLRRLDDARLSFPIRLAAE